MISSIPVLRPRLPTAIQVAPYLELMDRSRQYTNGGPLTRRLEEGYGRYLGADPEVVVAVASGTAGLTAALMALPPDKWYVPAWTFVASPMAVLQSGRMLEFCDAKDETGAPDFTEALARPDDSGILPVMHFGAFDIAPYADVEHVVVDAAASIINAAGGISGLSETSCVVFSLHATKIFGCGEGGIIVCGSGAMASRVRSVINFGLDGDRSAIRLGFNGKMSEISAAYALAALAHGSAEVQDWKLAQDRARGVSSKLGLKLVSPLIGDVTPYWVIMWPDDAGSLKDVRRYLENRGVMTRSWWPLPCSAMPAFHQFARSTPIADSLAKRFLGLPMFPDMTVSDFERIYSALEDALARDVGSVHAG